MLVMVVFFIAFRWIHLSTPLIRLFLLVLILLLMPTLNFLPVWFALSLLRSEERFSRNAETDLVCRLLLEKKNHFSWRAYNNNSIIVCGLMLYIKENSFNDPVKLCNYNVAVSI